MIDRRRSATLPRPGRAGAHRAPRRRSGRRLLWVVAGVALVALVTVLVLVPGPTDRLSRSVPPGQDASASRNAAGGPATALARWADTQLPPGTAVTVPRDVLPDVVAAGGDEQRFTPPGADASGLRLLTTEPPAGALVLARFTGGDDAVWTLVDPRPGRPTAEELARRQSLSAAVLANPGTPAAGRVADVLERGDVDPRLLGLLAGLVTQLGVGIADLPPAPDAPSGPGTGPLVRSAVIDRVGGEPVGTGRPATDTLLTFLDAQRAPYAPDQVEVTDEGVRIAFHYESAPDALVTESTP